MGTSNSIDFVNIFNLDLNADKNIFSLQNTNVGELNIINSFIKSNNFFDFDSSSSIDSGLIYNNVFLLPDSLKIYGANINLDFNTSLHQNKSLRKKIIMDSSSYVGGNLWLVSSGENVCSLEGIQDDSEPYGICDSPLTITGNFKDHYPLIAYGAYNVDLLANTLNVNVNKDTLIDLNIDFNFGNIE